MNILYVTHIRIRTHKISFQHTPVIELMPNILCLGKVEDIYKVTYTPSVSFLIYLADTYVIFKRSGRTT